MYKTAQFNEVVVLPCRSKSRLAKVTWRFSNNSIVPQFPYLQWTDGSLVFPVSPETTNTYRCVSEELGFQQTIATFAVNLPVVPRSHMSPSHQQPEHIDFNTIELDESEPINEEQINARSEEKQASTYHNAGKDTLSISQKSYFTEMVTFCFLFVICFCTLACFVVLWRNSKRCNKILPQKDAESDKICQTELEEKQS